MTEGAFPQSTGLEYITLLEVKVYPLASTAVQIKRATRGVKSEETKLVLVLLFCEKFNCEIFIQYPNIKG